MSNADLYLWEWKGVGGYQSLFWLIRPNYLAPSRVVPSRPWPKADVLLKKIEWGRAFLELCQHQTRWIEDAQGETPNSKLLLLQVVSTKALESLRLLRRKAFNSTPGKGSSTALSFRRLYWCQQKGTRLQIGYFWRLWCRRHQNDPSTSRGPFCQLPYIWKNKFI